jgi:hypothetical protein
MLDDTTRSDTRRYKVIRDGTKRYDTKLSEETVGDDAKRYETMLDDTTRSDTRRYKVIPDVTKRYDTKLQETVR